MELQIQQMACGKSHSLVLLSDGSVWATGDNYFGQLGDGTNDDRITWTSVIPSGSDVIQVAAGSAHSLALKSDGSLWATGGGDNGQLGHGTGMDKYTWTQVMASGVKQVTAGGFHSLALKSDGSLWATGNNDSGQLGNGTTKGKSTWTQVITSGVIHVAAGFSHSLVLKSDESVWATGYNRHGQLGDGTRITRTSWISVIPSGVTQVATGDSHSLALKADGSVWVAGYNELGELGDGTTTDKKTWTCVLAAGSDVIRVAAGAFYSLVLKSDGSVWATGYNEQGQLGYGTKTNKTTWTSVIPFGVTQLSAGDGHSFALKLDGALWKTGDNGYGQLGCEGEGSLVWMPDRFFEHLLLQSLLRQSDESPDAMTESADDWRGIFL